MSKTLDSGLRVLEVLASRGEPLTVTQLAEAIGVHRTVAHRFVRTLEAHRLVRRDRAKRFHLGAGLVPLAEPVERDLRDLALPLLEDLADAVGATAHLVVQEDEDHVRALMVVEPRSASVHVAFRAGQLDTLHRGSAGLAILSTRPPSIDEPEDVTLARRQGYAVSFSQIIPSMHGISAPVPVGPEAKRVSLGVSLFELSQEQEVATAVVATAHQLGRALA
ncbi:transcriptional regulator [Marmoricola endophyticus]|uniref:Transcriptional regulator n=1 Tax=Marmoricola endophyticus TaxID=2040280 RepID=A0A917BKD0_9ACTN|nr:helix-turn-helix domain-containing protein [Marmoricola endophyticus]GGF49184.1 transcriptional regulator [Marmoricola endophyticus]